MPSFKRIVKLNLGGEIAEFEYHLPSMDLIEEVTSRYHSGEKSGRDNTSVHFERFIWILNHPDLTFRPLDEWFGIDFDKEDSDGKTGKKNWLNDFIVKYGPWAKGFAQFINNMCLHGASQLPDINEFLIEQKIIEVLQKLSKAESKIADIAEGDKAGDPTESTT